MSWATPAAAVIGLFKKEKPQPQPIQTTSFGELFNPQAPPNPPQKEWIVQPPVGNVAFPAVKLGAVPVATSPAQLGPLNIENIVKQISALNLPGANLERAQLDVGLSALEKAKQSLSALTDLATGTGSPAYKNIRNTLVGAELAPLVQANKAKEESLRNALMAKGMSFADASKLAQQRQLGERQAAYLDLLTRVAPSAYQTAIAAAAQAVESARSLVPERLTNINPIDIAQLGTQRELANLQSTSDWQKTLSELGLEYAKTQAGFEQAAKEREYETLTGQLDWLRKLYETYLMAGLQAAGLNRQFDYSQLGRIAEEMQNLLYNVGGSRSGSTGGSGTVPALPQGVQTTPDVLQKVRDIQSRALPVPLTTTKPTVGGTPHPVLSNYVWSNLIGAYIPREDYDYLVALTSKAAGGGTGTAGTGTTGTTGTGSSGGTTTGSTTDFGKQLQSLLPNAPGSIISKLSTIKPEYRQALLDVIRRAKTFSSYNPQQGYKWSNTLGTYVRQDVWNDLYNMINYEPYYK